MSAAGATWSAPRPETARVVEICTAPRCERHGTEQPNTDVLAPKQLAHLAGRFSVVCCFDPDLGATKLERQSVLRAVRSALAAHGIAIFRATGAIETQLGRAGFAEWQREDHCDPVLTGLTGSDGILVARAEQRRLGTGSEQLTLATLYHRAQQAPPAQSAGTTVVVPIRNEAQNLFAFLAFLERLSNRLHSRREFVLVVNGSDDESELMARDWAATSSLDARVLTSEPGIVPAFRTGAADSRFGGFVGKLDADVIVHPFLLDALELHLLTTPELRVTHADPLPADSFSCFSEPDHRPGTLSRRLYFNGKASLYRGNPFSWPGVAELPFTPRAEDVFFSLYLHYLEGPESIGLAPGGHVFQKTIRTFEDLVGMLSRTRSELRRHGAAFPPFAALSLLLDQRVLSPAYAELLARAAPQIRDVDHWLRLESTK